MSRSQRVAAAIALALCCSHGAHASILVTAALDKAQFYPGEQLNYQITAHNPATDAVTLYFNTGGQAHYILDGGPPEVNGQSQALTQRTIPAQSSYTWTIANDWRYSNPAIGPHEYIGGVVGYGNAAPILFDVVAPALPASGFTIDFETLPGSTVVPLTVTEFWPYGVRFRSESTSSFHRPVFGSSGGNRYLGTSSSTNPPGYNIIAEFEIPVHGLTVDVSGAAGRQISMIARDSQGNVLDTVVSAPIPVTGEFLPLSIDSIIPIASLEWWSNPNNTIRVDNLAITLPEPGGVLAGALSLLVVWMRRRAPCHTCH